MLLQSIIRRDEKTLLRIDFFSWQEIRNIHGEINDENKNNFQVHYNGKTMTKN